jgi:F420-dependent oxidoreductase-like protein
MRLGLNLGYWGAGNDADNLELARVADRLGYSVVWAAEAYGSDVPSVLAWVGAQTTRIDLGAAVMQIPARTPAATAMTAATLDSLSGGRFRLGLGVSGPQVSEGWHGVRFAKPIGRTREYVAIVEQALRRERVRFDGTHYQLPLPDGPGKALRLTVHPVRKHIPIYLAAIGPRNLRLTGEIADGWLGIFVSPEHLTDPLGEITAGRGERGMDDFDVVASIPLSFDDDYTTAVDRVRGYCALYIGGMGSPKENFYNALARRMGYAEAADVVQERYLARDYSAAAAAVPTEFIEATSLLGSPARVAERMQAYAAAGVTTLTVIPFANSLPERIAALERAVDALDRSGVGS